MKVILSLDATLSQETSVFSGNSQITNTIGTRLTTLSEDAIGIAYADFDPRDAENKMITERNHVLKDRRPVLYKRIIKSD